MVREPAVLGLVAASKPYRPLGAGHKGYAFSGDTAMQLNLGSWLRRLVWMRVGLTGMLVLAVVLPFVVVVQQPMLANLFELQSWGGVYLINCMSVLAAWICYLCAMVAYDHAPKRSPEYMLSWLPCNPTRRMRYVAYSSLLALPLFVAVGWQSTTVTYEPIHPIALESAPLGRVVVVSAGLACLVTMLLLLALMRLARKRLHDWASTRRLGFDKMRGLGRLPKALQAGYIYIRSDGSVMLFPGHMTMSLFVLVLLIIYFLARSAFHPVTGWLGQPPALMYLLLLLMLLTTVGAGAAFFLDRFRIPLLLGVLGWLLITVGTKPGHTFEVERVAGGRGGQTVIEMPMPAQTVEPWLAKQKADRPTLVIVCASGGGIQASAWTASVLTWLQEDSDPRLGQDFIRSIRFFSSTSGGSVGVMYFLQGYDPSLRAPPQDRDHLAAIRRAARASSLSQTAWGMTYPDFGRSFWPVRIVSTDIDRAWATEQAWHQQFCTYPHLPSHLNPRWSDWTKATAAGELPGVVFNAFDVNSGDRVLINTVQLPAAGADTITMLPEYSGPPGRLNLDFDVVTAARLSATFPYISPIASARERGGQHLPSPLLRVADGGYFDNFGVLAASEWIRSLLGDPHQPTPFRDRLGRIVILEIRAFGSGQATAGSPSSIYQRWINSLAGPVQGVLRVRTTTQQARNDSLIEMLKQAYGDRFIERVVFAPNTDEWPLSWHLSPSEKLRLDDQQYGAFKEARDKLLALLPRPGTLSLDSSTAGGVE